MGLESATYISELNEAWPLGTDGKNTLDNHARMTKAVLKNTFPNIGAAAVTGTAAQINAAVASGGLSTVSSSTTSLSISVASKSLTVEASKGFAAGQAIQLTYDLTNYMTGNVTSYNSTTGALVVSVSAVVGSGTYAAWAVFVITQAPPFSDGNAHIKNASDTTKVAKFDASGITTGTTRTYALPDLSGSMALSGGDNYIALNSGNGHGSTNTKIRRFTTTEGSAGTTPVYADSVALGASFTIPVGGDGFYFIASSDAKSSGAAFNGISLNTAQPTVSIFTITATARKSMVQSTAGNTPARCYALLKLVAGDVIRPHTDGTQDTTDDVATSFFMMKVSV